VESKWLFPHKKNSAFGQVQWEERNGKMTAKELREKQKKETNSNGEKERVLQICLGKCLCILLYFGLGMAANSPQNPLRMSFFNPAISNYEGKKLQKSMELF
jgi:hypothetical protein